MASFREHFEEVKDAVLAFVRQTKDSYEGASNFVRMRVWILAALGIDVFVVLIIALTVGGRDLEVDVWYQPGFPSNMLVIRNEEGESLIDVSLELDRRFKLKVPRMSPGLQGFDVNRDFADAGNVTPEEGYKPRVLRLSYDGDTYELEVSEKAK